ncbi:unnamed protein product [Haemonchus placei]|uniref:Ig-like domain-containing protein n=1 Tax=Haemonchus placei TaxID=6290 RepID=A0A0N4XAE2_HAEPC|nr:unnamed protein product [Haemonchus placei]
MLESSKNTKHSLESDLLMTFYLGLEDLFEQKGEAGHAVSDEILSCLRQERAKLENPVQNVVTVTAQEPAYLHCRIPQRTNHMVAWTRASDQALLTAGHHSFTSDPRFQVSKKSDTDWILILRSVLLLFT